MKPRLKTKIMVFGTFDVLHKGHLDFFRQARKLSANPFLIVSVARDVNVKKIKKRKPVKSEAARRKIISQSQLVDRAVMGGMNNHLPHILKQRPQIIALGYDQQAYVKNLKSQLAQKGLKVKIRRLKAFKPKIYKSSKLKLKI